MSTRVRNFTLVMFLAACQEAPAPLLKSAPAIHASVVATPAQLLRVNAQLMGTPFQITFPANADATTGQYAANQVFKTIAAIESTMSEWRADSELSAINRAAGQGPVAVSAELRHVIEHAQAVSRASEGAFDVTWAALRGVWDFKHPKLPPPDILKAAVDRIDWRQIKIDNQAGTVELLRPAMAIGLGGIAKGYALDVGAEMLKNAGFTAFIIDGGGDLRVAGQKSPGVPWSLGIRHPRTGKILHEFPMTDGALVSSGDYERFFMLEGTRYHHILDVKTGLPARASVSVTVLAKEAVIADALATAIFVLGPKKGLILADQFKAQAAVLTPDGRVHVTAGLQGWPTRWRADRPPRRGAETNGATHSSHSMPLPQ